MELTRTTMVERMLQSDTSYNGRYLTAVKTTGIYCLPGCRARKPKPENMEFFAAPEAAQAAGYRACKLCRPTDFYQGINPEETLIEALVASVRDEPERYRDVGEMATAAGVGQTKLFELFRVHYHTTPADMLVRQRVAAACHALLETSRSITTIANDVGFESLSAFNENFRKQTALAPGHFRRMRETASFTLTLPKDYDTARILRYLGRDPASLTDRVEGATWTSTLRLGATTGALVRVTIAAELAHVEVLLPAAPDAAAMARIHAHVLAALGLSYDPARFEAQVAKTPTLAPLIVGQRGLRVPLLSDPFDGLIWAILGQQITVTFAFTLRRRLIERVSDEIAPGWFLPPAPTAVAALEEADLVPLAISRAKAAYLTGAAQAVVDGRLPLAALAGQSATRIERVLLAQRGIGPWSAHYLLMRAYGFLDCIPLGDTGLTTSLQRLFALPERPDKGATLTLMEPFSPYRSLATFHLWERLKV